MEAAGCGLCSETKSIVAFCRECKEFMCDDCKPPHKRMKIFSGHETVPVNNVNNTCAVLSANNTRRGSRGGNTGPIPPPPPPPPPPSSYPVYAAPTFFAALDIVSY